jgi:hypothetical protein
MPLIHSIHTSLSRRGLLSRKFKQLNILDDLYLISKISPLLGAFPRILSANLHRYSLYNANIIYPLRIYAIRYTSDRFLFLHRVPTTILNPDGTWKNPKKKGKNVVNMIFLQKIPGFCHFTGCFFL